MYLQHLDIEWLPLDGRWTNPAVNLLALLQKFALDFSVDRLVVQYLIDVWHYPG